MTNILIGMIIGFILGYPIGWFVHKVVSREVVTLNVPDLIALGCFLLLFLMVSASILNPNYKLGDQAMVITILGGAIAGVVGYKYTNKKE